MNTSKQGFSIIMTVFDQAHELKGNLTAFLTQVYEPGYEVIVVDETSTDDTSNVLKLYKQDYPPLSFPNRAEVMYVGRWPLISD